MSKPASSEGIAPNAMRLLWAGFMAILAAGVGFAIRGGILDNWAAEFNFSATQLGLIGGAAGIGFCLGIIGGGVVADKIGYGSLVVGAFLMHVLSAFVTFAALEGTATDRAYLLLYWGTFIFSMANGTLEAVANPLVATLFPHNRTHYLNILHASWPAGLVLGGAAGWILDDWVKLDWKLQLGLFLVPTLIYGAMFFGQAMPKSEASQRGLRLHEMFHDVGILGAGVVCVLLAMFLASEVFRPLLQFVFAVEADAAARYANYIGTGLAGVIWLAVAFVTRFSIGSILLFVLFIAHALVGAVELGTDSWIQNITGNLLTSGQGKMLFVWTSLLMFLLRFCADFIEKKIGLSPVGILLTCSVLACLGLLMTSRVGASSSASTWGAFAFAFAALTVYGVGKTFFWPTMLAVASDRFPRTGAIAISMMGGIGMLSFGMIGSPALGYFKDRYAAEELREVDPTLYEQYKGDKKSQFLFFPSVTALDGKKLGEVKAALQAEREGRGTATEEQKTVQAADMRGDRRTLVADAAIPAAMAVIYLGLLIYFASIGGYKPVHIDGERLGGGIEGPVR
jgi:MFS family permease